MKLGGLHEALGIPAAAAWRRFAAALVLSVDDLGRIRAMDVDAISKTTSIAVPANEMRAVLLQLGVLVERGPVFRLDHQAMQRVSVALEFAGEDVEPDEDRWETVATIPRSFPRKMLPEGITSTKACVLALLACARDEIWLASPYLDFDAIKFLVPLLQDAIHREVSVRLLTAEKNADFIARFLESFTDEKSSQFLMIWEAQSLSSLLGTHAKAIVADRKSAYLGSANLTSYGLDKHFELGVRLSGGGVGKIVRLLEAISREGTVRFPPAAQHEAKGLPLDWLAFRKPPNQ